MAGWEIKSSLLRRHGQPRAWSAKIAFAPTIFDFIRLPVAYSPVSHFGLFCRDLIIIAAVLIIALLGSRFVAGHMPSAGLERAPDPTKDVEQSFARDVEKRGIGDYRVIVFDRIQIFKAQNAHWPSKARFSKCCHFWNTVCGFDSKTCLNHIRGIGTATAAQFQNGSASRQKPQKINDETADLLGPNSDIGLGFRRIESEGCRVV
jgi:hypothetical protein